MGNPMKLSEALQNLATAHGARAWSDIGPAVADLGRVAAAELVSIRAEALRKGWRYVATDADGTEFVVRQQATRLYGFAHVWSAAACTGKGGLGTVVTFTSGSRAGRAWGDTTVLRSFPIAAPAVQP
jgi:hypothetical protein